MIQTLSKGKASTTGGNLCRGQQPRVIDGRSATCGPYGEFHDRRISATVDKLRAIGARRVVEVGGHPWAMTARLVDASFQVCATVSAEEITQWPDDIGVTAGQYQLQTPGGRQVVFANYSANIERTLFDIDGSPDTVVACEIVEHLIRAPHVMFLNINRWLPTGGQLLVTTPNGCQFENPFRRKTRTPAYRCHVYERHSFLYSRQALCELIELCGFRILEAGFWDVYQRRGMSRLYGVLSRLPSRYCQEKFSKVIMVVAEKTRAVSQLARCPRVYQPCKEWEFVNVDGRSRS